MMANFLIMILILHISVLFTIVHCDIFFSISHLEESVTRARVQNRELKELLNSYVDEQMERMERADRLIQELQNLSGDEIKDPTFKITHPFNAYRFIRNHSEIFNTTLIKAVTEISSFENDSVSIWESNITQLTKDLPSIRDLNGSTLALQRIQTTYNVSTTYFADGSLVGMPDSNLTADECRDITAILYASEFYASGKEWLAETKHRQRLEKASNASVEVVMRLAARSALKTGNVIAAMLAIDGKHKPNYVDRKTTLLAIRVRSKFMRFLKTSTPVEAATMKEQAFKSYNRPSVYTTLCTGQAATKQSEAPFRDNLLSCRYETNGDPYLMIQPVKYERLSSKPYIAEYHDVFSNKDIQAMKKEAKGNMTRTNRVGYNSQMLAYWRIYVRALLSDNRSTTRLIDKVSAITSLQAGGDPTQVVNYGVGGFYGLHHDGIRDVENDRIATFMVYLSDVEKGGATIFPNANVTVFPKKGSALFWRNMYRNGTTFDQKAFHSACPIIKGDKWIATFLIRENGQEFRWPCTLNEFD